MEFAKKKWQEIQKETRAAEKLTAFEAEPKNWSSELSAVTDELHIGTSSLIFDEASKDTIDQNVAKVGFVKGSQPPTMQNTLYNLTPDPYYSDGNRAVMFFEERPATLDKIELLDWEENRIRAITE